MLRPRPASGNDGQAASDRVNWDLLNPGWPFASGGGRHDHSGLRQSESEAYGAQPGRAGRCGRFVDEKAFGPATLRSGNGFSAIRPMWSADANHDILLGMVVTTASRND